MTPKQVKVMAAIRVFEASEQLADAIDNLIKARRNGLSDNFPQLEEVAAFRLRLYRQARADYENL